MTNFEFTVPVLVVGGGACGAVAALAANDAGAAPLLIEQDARPMGSTGMSQGLVCAAGTKAQAVHGVDDSGAVFLADIMAKTRGQADPAIARAIAYGSGPTLDWLVETHALPWTLDTGFRAAYGNSRLRVHGWRGHGGMDMIQLLHRRLSEGGIDVMLQARMTDIIVDRNGRALGVEVQRPDGSSERVGCETLILASGGFAANLDMVAQHIPEMVAARNNGHEGSKGDAVRLGSKLGAGLGDMGSYQGYAMLTDPQGISVPPGVLIEGGIIVNCNGQRFVDETDDIGGMVNPAIAQPGDHCWVVFDAGIEHRCAYIPEMQTLMALNAARTADSVAELAQQIKADAAILRAVLREAHEAQKMGHADAQGRIWGDDRPPDGSLRALKIIGAIYHTQGGLQIDAEARVLRKNRMPFPNIFAGGGAARGVSGPSSWGYLPAMGLCAAVTLGRIAGEAAARQIDGR